MPRHVNALFDAAVHNLQPGAVRDTGDGTVYEVFWPQSPLQPHNLTMQDTVLCKMIHDNKVLIRKIKVETEGNIDTSGAFPVVRTRGVNAGAWTIHPSSQFGLGLRYLDQCRVSHLQRVKFSAYSEDSCNIIERCDSIPVLKHVHWADKQLREGYMTIPQGGRKPCSKRRRVGMWSGNGIRSCRLVLKSLAFSVTAWSAFLFDWM